MTAEELRVQLKHHRISTRELAAEAGVTDRAVRWWKAGHRSIPEGAVVRALERIAAQRSGYRKGVEDAAAAAHKAISQL